ncbi:CHASE2 domain-containing protein [Gemmobacter lanyuensis]
MRVWHALTLLLVAGLAALLAAAPQPLVNLQERLFDHILPGPTAAPIWVVDIGAIDDAGAEWTRAATARLVARLSEAHPRVMAFDILFAGACDEPATRDLARALEGQTVVLGLLLSDVPGPRLPAPWLGTAGAAPLWPARGAEIPCPQFAAHDIAAMALMGMRMRRCGAFPSGWLLTGRRCPALRSRWQVVPSGGCPLSGPVGCASVTWRPCPLPRG